MPRGNLSTQALIQMDIEEIDRIANPIKTQKVYQYKKPVMEDSVTMRIKNFTIPNHESKNPFYQAQLRSFRARMALRGIRI